MGGISGSSLFDGVFVVVHHGRGAVERHGNQLAVFVGVVGGDGADQILGVKIDAGFRGDLIDGFDRAARVDHCRRPDLEDLQNVRRLSRPIRGDARVHRFGVAAFELRVDFVLALRGVVFVDQCGQGFAQGAVHRMPKGDFRLGGSVRPGGLRFRAARGRCGVPPRGRIAGRRAGAQRREGGGCEDGFDFGFEVGGQRHAKPFFWQDREQSHGARRKRPKLNQEPRAPIRDVRQRRQNSAGFVVPMRARVGPRPKRAADRAPALRGEDPRRVVFFAGSTNCDRLS